jgi:DNA polymerase beta
MEEISHSYTNEFIEILEEFKSIMELKGDVFRAKAYQTALESIMSTFYEITEPKIQLKMMKGIGTTIYNKLIEYVDTGKIESLINERKNPIIQFTTIYGIGPKKAQELISLGINKIEELNLPENSCHLNDKQKIGLKYQKYINEKIPRNEINQYKKVFDKLIDTINKSICCDDKLQYEIVGSYRRGKEMSGDIDVIITNTSSSLDNNSEKIDNELFELFINTLIKNKIIIEVLSKGKSKSLTICKLSNSDEYIPRRIDFLYCSKKEYPFALLYFTGSKRFNTLMRQCALDNGYTLNEHGIYYIKNGVKGKMIDNYEFIDEPVNA